MNTKSTFPQFFNHCTDSSVEDHAHDHPLLCAQLSLDLYDRDVQGDSGRPALYILPSLVFALLLNCTRYYLLQDLTCHCLVQIL